MTRSTAREVFALLARVFGLYLAYRGVLVGAFTAFDGLMQFIWWVVMIALAWLLVFRADAIARLSYPQHGSQEPATPGE